MGGTSAAAPAPAAPTGEGGNIEGAPAPAAIRGGSAAGAAPDRGGVAAAIIVSFIQKRIGADTGLGVAEDSQNGRKNDKHLHTAIGEGKVLRGQDE